MTWDWNAFQDAGCSVFTFLFPSAAFNIDRDWIYHIGGLEGRKGIYIYMCLCLSYIRIISGLYREYIGVIFPTNPPGLGIGFGTGAEDEKEEGAIL